MAALRSDRAQPRLPAVSRGQSFVHESTGTFTVTATSEGGTWRRRGSGWSSVSTDAAPCRTLAEYVRQLVVRLAEDEPAAFEELRRTVGARSATLGLDDETVLVHVQGGEILVHLSVSGGDGTGWTDGNCVLDLIDGAAVSGITTSPGQLDEVAMDAVDRREVVVPVSRRSPPADRPCVRRCRRLAASPGPTVRPAPAERVGPAVAEVVGVEQPVARLPKQAVEPDLGLREPSSPFELRRRRPDVDRRIAFARAARGSPSPVARAVHADRQPSPSNRPQGRANGARVGLDGLAPAA